MTALSAVLPRSVVQNITKNNKLFPGVHGTQEQLRALWKEVTEDGRIVVVDDNFDTGLQIPETVPRFNRKIKVWIAVRWCKKTKKRKETVLLEMKVEHRLWYEPSVGRRRSRYFSVLSRKPYIFREVQVEQSEKTRLAAFRQVLIDFSRWYSTLRLCSTPLSDTTRRAFFCGGRAMPGSAMCTGCVLKRGFQAKRSESRAKRQRLE